MMKFSNKIILMCVALMFSAGGALSASCTKDLNLCSNRQICNEAAFKGSWGAFSSSQKYIIEAVRRGLTCGVKYPPPIVGSKKTLPIHTSELQKSFQSLIKAKRKNIQSNLAGLGFYNFSIDGLYGKGTAAALTKFNEQYLSELDLKDKNSVQNLLQFLLKLDSHEALTEGLSDPNDEAQAPASVILGAAAVAEPEKTTCVENPILCTPVELCTRSTMIKDDLTLWSDSADAMQFVSVAKKININCGVYVEPSCDTDAALCSVAELCEKSVIVIGGQNAWADTPAAEQYLKLSKQFGLACLNTVPIVQTKVIKTVDYVGDFKNEYTGQSLLKRKQLQYALKKLGFYSSSIDGLWGKGTGSAIVDYAQDNGVSGNSPSSVFRSILSKVDVPSSFEVQQKKVVAPKQDNAGLTAIISNPSITGRQAMAMCEPQAEQSKNQARSFSGSSNSRFNCTRTLLGASCDSGPSNKWEAIGNAIDRSKAGSSAYSATLSACLAQLGWQ